MPLIKISVILALTGFTIQGCPGPTKPSDGVKIFAEEEWYTERPEKEVLLEGFLQLAEPQQGPNARLGLDYQLIMEKQALPVYAAKVNALLQPFTDKKVKIKGKIVDLSNEGFEKELWIGFISRK